MLAAPLKRHRKGDYTVSIEGNPYASRVMMREIKKVTACSKLYKWSIKFSIGKQNGAVISQSMTRGLEDVPLTEADLLIQSK